MPRGRDGAWFTIGGCAGYIALLLGDAPVLRYYPLTGTISRVALGVDQGPAMAWYGLLVGAVVLGLAMVLAARLLRFTPTADRLGLAAMVLAIAGCAYAMRGFFV